MQCHFLQHMWASFLIHSQGKCPRACARPCLFKEIMNLLLSAMTYAFRKSYPSYILSYVNFLIFFRDSFKIVDMLHKSGFHLDTLNSIHFM